MTPFFLSMYLARLYELSQINSVSAFFQTESNYEKCRPMRPYQVVVRIGPHVLYRQTWDSPADIPIPKLSPNTSYQVQVSSLSKNLLTLPLR